MSSLYDTDVYQWSERQAAALRSLAARRDLPNDVRVPDETAERECFIELAEVTIEDFDFAAFVASVRSGLGGAPA